MTTEDVSPRFLDLDLWETLDGLKALQDGQMEAVAAVKPALPAIAAAVDAAVPRLRRGGRLVYVGAGTSGRIAVQDGAELLPTFNWPSEQVVFAIAGGERALLRAVENAEDSGADGAEAMRANSVSADDVVLGVAASGNTPFTVSALRAARAAGALTVGVANNAGSQVLAVSEHAVLIETGAEAVAGSTRMKAGTAQKVVLNLFSTMAMVKMGRVYRGVMVDMRPTNEKLRRRAVQMVVSLAGCAEEVAAGAVAKSGGDVKLAVLFALGLEGDAARALLARHDGNLRHALAEIAGR